MLKSPNLNPEKYQTKNGHLRGIISRTSQDLGSHFPSIRKTKMAPPNIRYFMEHKARHKAKTKPKIQTTKLMDRLTYNPKKHKQRKVRDMRERLQRKAPPPVSKPLPPPTKLKFGSFNVNGLDLEASWAVQQLLDKRGFDVSIFL